MSQDVNMKYVEPNNRAIEAIDRLVDMLKPLNRADILMKRVSIKTAAFAAVVAIILLSLAVTFAAIVLPILYTAANQ